jgi:hypothetical protein
VAARAQQGDRVRRIGVLMPGDENDPHRRHQLHRRRRTTVQTGSVSILVNG